MSRMHRGAPIPITSAVPPVEFAIPNPSGVQQAERLLDAAAGYVGIRIARIGLATGLIATLADHPGVTPAELARLAGHDPFYTSVWCRAAEASAWVERDESAPVGGRYRLAPGANGLLLDPDSPTFAAGLVAALTAPEVFDGFEAALPTGRRTWWDELAPAFIDAAADVGRAFYRRLIPDGLARVPGLAQQLAGSIAPTILELACGTGSGLVRLAEAFPSARLLGVDGDAHSVALARQRVEAAGMAGRVELEQRPLESLDRHAVADLALISISLHEARDIERVVRLTSAALKPGGVFVVSDFPFPTEPDGLRSPAGRVMSAFQLFEARIGDQLLPTAAYLDLLRRHRFADVAAIELGPTHVVVHARKP